MNKRQLERLGFPPHSLQKALEGIRQAAEVGRLRGVNTARLMKQVLRDPAAFRLDPHFDELAAMLTEQPVVDSHDPIEYPTWGEEGIEPDVHRQMRNACSLPMARSAALMPDAHIGYGLPIGGVLGLENAVCPYAVGVDIACRMKLSVLDMPVASLSEDRSFEKYKNSLEKGTRFGVGKQHQTPQDHAVMDQDWTVSRVTREKKDVAWRQLGTSGSGNHFVEFGLLTLPEEELGLEAGQYVALMSHSGSRGPGHAVCSTYSNIARRQLPAHYSHLGQLSWLGLDTQEGQEYWAAMNLMGDYASANHDVIHRLVSKLLGARVIAGVENHHNFAWKEIHDGRELIVHRKGATPAGEGVLGVIPGSMASPAYVVRGKGNAASLHSASHGAGRLLSRKKAKQTYRFNAVRNNLAKQGIRVLSAGADEVPGVYKDIDEVMRSQQDLVDAIGRFDPKIVKMCGDGSRAED